MQDVPIAAVSLNNLARFGVQNRLQRATMTFIVSQLASDVEIRNLRDIFSSLDSNGDGKLSREELKNGYEKFQNTLKLDIDDLIEKCDSDYSGYIDYTEFLTAATDWGMTLSKERLYKAFKIYDIDGSGKISLEELKQTMGGNDRNSSYFVQMLKEADINCDGEIDFQEFTQVMLKEMEDKTSNQV